MNVIAFITLVLVALGLGIWFGGLRERLCQRTDEHTDERAQRFLADRARADAINDAADQAITGNEREVQL